MSMFVTELVPAYFVALNPVAAEATRKLGALSKVVETLTAKLPHAETVRGVFLPEGSKTGSQFRCVVGAVPCSCRARILVMLPHCAQEFRLSHASSCHARSRHNSSVMHVLDIALNAQPRTLRNAANALTAWYWQAKKVPLDEAELGQLQELMHMLWTALEPFKQFGATLATWKLHCATKLAETVRLYGSAEHVTTDAYERAHKAHKAVFQRYACSAECMCSIFSACSTNNNAMQNAVRSRKYPFSFV